MRDRGVLEHVGRDWRVTAAGFEVLRVLPVVAKKSRPKRKSVGRKKADRLSRRADSFRVFERESVETVD